MSIEALRVISRVSWVVTCALLWLVAYRGGSSTPRFDMWFWGGLAALNLIGIGSAIQLWATK